MSNFFSASCAPGAQRGSKLCELCRGDCSRSHSEPYYDYGGAFQSVSLFILLILLQSSNNLNTLVVRAMTCQRLYTAGDSLTCNADAPVGWSTLQVSGRRRWRGRFCEASHCTWSVSHNHTVSSARCIGHLK